MALINIKARIEQDQSNHLHLYRVLEVERLSFRIMRLFLLNLSIILLTVSASCRHSIAPEQNDTADYNYTDDLNQAQTWFNGQWKLIAVSAMIPNPPVPNVQLVVTSNQITLVRDGKPIDQGHFEIIKTQNYIQLKTTVHPREDNWYIHDSGLRVSRNQLFLDTGMALDLPGYSFERVK